MQTNTTTPAGKKGKYSAIATIGKDDGSIDGKETGEYICKNLQNPEESIRYYIFVPGCPKMPFVVLMYFLLTLQVHP